MPQVYVTRDQILEALSDGGFWLDFPLTPVKKPEPEPEQTDLRPYGWQDHVGYEFKSSRDPNVIGHQVTMGYDNKYACDCAASRFGNECWALNAVRNERIASQNAGKFPGLSFRTYFPDILRTQRGAGKKIVIKWREKSDFGNRKAVLL